jgi:hypothetical protein
MISDAPEFRSGSMYQVRMKKRHYPDLKQKPATVMVYKEVDGKRLLVAQVEPQLKISW